MTEIVFDFADIRSRMLGEDRPKRKPAELMKVMPVPQSEADARPGSDRTIIYTRLPRGAWRRLNCERPLHQHLLSPQEIVEAAMLKLQQMRGE